MNKKITQDDTENLDEFEKRVNQITRDYNVTTENKIDEIALRKTTTQLVTTIAAIKQITFDHALIGLAALIQSGGHLRSVQNRKIRIKDVEFTKKDLLFASDQINNPFTLRTIARGINKTIAAIAIQMKIPGNLYSQFKIENPNHRPDFIQTETLKIAVYCTDFQYENPDTPEIVKVFLSNRLTKK